MTLTGKVALVTGAAQGIGRSMVEELLAKGASVVMLDINSEKGKACKETQDIKFGSEKTLFIHADVTNRDQMKDAFKKTIDHFKKLDIMINNAGINNEKHWKKTINVNLIGTIQGTYLALEYMKTQNGGEGGVIINMSSLAGLMPAAYQPSYTASKYGIVGFTRAIAAASNAGEYGVRINTICPAFVETPLLKSVDNEEYMGEYFKYKENIKEMMNQYGILEPSLVAEGMINLVEDTSLNGAVMKVTCSEGIHFEEYAPQYEPKM